MNIVSKSARPSTTYRVDSPSSVAQTPHPTPTADLIAPLMVQLGRELRAGQSALSVMNHCFDHLPDFICEPLHEKLERRICRSGERADDRRHEITRLLLDLKPVALPDAETWRYGVSPLVRHQVGNQLLILTANPAYNVPFTDAELLARVILTIVEL